MPEIMMPRSKTRAGIEKLIAQLQELGWVCLGPTLYHKGYYEQQMRRGNNAVRNTQQEAR